MNNFYYILVDTGKGKTSMHFWYQPSFMILPVKGGSLWAF